MKRTIRVLALGVVLSSALSAHGAYASVQPAVPAADSAPADKASSEALDKKGQVIQVLDTVNQPWGLAMLPDGGLIAAVSGGNQIVKWKDGKLEAITALGTTGYFDGTTANSLFNQPTYAAVNSKGVIYISDTENHVVRRIVGTRVYTAAGDGTPGSKNGKFGEARFNAPAGLAIDAQDNVYVADALNNVIRKITPDGVTSTVAGAAADIGGYRDGAAGDAAFNEPSGLAFDEKGGLFVADSGNHLIRYIFEGKVTTVAGLPTEADEFTGYMDGGYRNGSSEEARFNRPRGLAYADGVLFIADSLNNRIRALRPDGSVVTLTGQSVPGNEVGAAAEARFNQPSALLYQSGNLYIADTLNNSVKALAVKPDALQPLVTEEDLVAQVDLQPAADIAQVWLDGKRLDLSNNNQPFIQREQLYVPARAIFEAWGAVVKWNPAQKEAGVTKAAVSFKLKVGADGPVILRKGGMFVSAAYLEQVAPLLIVQDEEYNAIIIGGTY